MHVLHVREEWDVLHQLGVYCQQVSLAHLLPHIIIFIFSGTSSGSCASSFGVCCIFEKSCDGASVSQNTTYFTSSSRALGESCKLTICKVREHNELLRKIILHFADLC